MAAETSLNRIVKGAPPPDTKLRPIAPLPPLAAASNETIQQITSQPLSQTPNSETAPTLPVVHISSDPHTSALPSSPPQIYLNLLILEASLRTQYLHLLTRRRLNTFFLTLLLLWNLSFTYFLFLRPREDGSGLGGSPYWVIELGIRLGFISGWLSVLLVKATGQWERGVRWPRKWLGTTNRGLRPFNLRVALVKSNFWLESLAAVLPLPLILGYAMGNAQGDWHLVETPAVMEEGGVGARIVEEDLSKGGDHLMLLLLPKNFSSEFRENWETYRSEYWERENLRRAALRRKVGLHQRAKAKEIGGWKWWTGAWKIISPHSATAKHKKHGDLDKHSHAHQHHSQPHSHGHSRSSTLTEKDITGAKSSRRRSLMRSDSNHSRQSSRSSTPHLNPDGVEDLASGPKQERVRRGSSVSSTSSVRKSLRLKREETAGRLSPLTMAEDESPGKDRKKRRSNPSTPTLGSLEEAQVKKEPTPA